MLKFVTGLFLSLTCLQGFAQTSELNEPLTIADMDCASGLMVPLEAVQRIICEAKGAGGCLQDRTLSPTFDESYYQALKVCLSAGQPPKNAVSKK